jgi:hypothetical protein
MKIFIGLLAAFSLLTGTVSAQTAYQDDETDFYVENQANEALAFVNMLICYMRAMAPDKMVNKGSYIANIYVDECEAEDNSSSDKASATPTSAQSASNAGSGAASGSEATGGHEVEANVVTVTRTDNNSPMIVSAWVNQDAVEEEDMSSPATDIFVKGTQTVAPSASSKFGTFSMDATYTMGAAFTPGEGMDPIAKGTKYGGMHLEANGSTVKFRDENMFGAPESLVATFTSDGVSGVYNQDAGVPYGGDYAMVQTINKFAITDSGKAYCSQLVSAKRMDFADTNETGGPTLKDYTPTGSDGLVTDEVCYSTAVADAKRNVWRYGVYKADGSRYELGQGGFPMKAQVTVGSETQTVHAWGDYGGVHVDAQFASAVKFVGDSSPTTFTKEQFSGESGTPPTYQIKQAHSRISKISKTYVALDSLDKANVVMWVDKWDTNWSGKYNTLGFTGASGEYSGSYTASTKTWAFDKKITFTSGYAETSLSTPISFTNATWVSTMQKSYGSGSDTWTDNRNLWLWSRDEGQSYEIGKKSLENPTDSSSTNGIAVESRETLTPKDFPSSLFCVEQCPTAAKLTATVNAAKALSSAGGTVVSPYDANNWQILQSGSDAGNQFPGILSSNVQTYTITGVQVKDSTGNEVMFAADIVNPTEQLKMANYAWPWGSTGELQWGVRTGKLFATQADLDKLECEKAADGSYRDTHPVFNASAKRYCPDAIYADDNTITTWYEVSFGANPWDRQKFLVDQSTSQDVVFTPPVTLYYDVPNEAKYGEDKGKKIRLDYNGFGELHGVPGEVVDTTTGESLGNYITGEWKEQYRYVQRFLLENDAAGNPPTVSTGGASPTTYKVKALQGDEWLTLKPSVKSTLTYSNSASDLPGSSVLVDVHSGATGGGIGVEPTTGFLNAGKAAVIHGDKVIAD